MEFQFKAATMEGAVVESSIEAEDQSSAVEKIKKAGYIPISVSSQKKILMLSVMKPCSRKDVLTFTTELAALLGAGLQLDRSLLIISGVSESAKIQDVSRVILKSIREGRSFSEALSRHPGVFDRLYVNMVKAGESGGVLDSVMGKLNEFLETQSELRSHVVSSLIYPAILMITSGISMVVLLIFVLPKFSAIFGEFGSTLPLSTQILLSFSNFIAAYYWAIIVMMIGVIFVFRSFAKTENGKRAWDTAKLKLLGEIITRLETARFCRTLGTLLRSGVPLLQALASSRDVINNSVISSTIDSVSRGVREGKGISTLLGASGLFPQFALSMIKVGEETGHLDEMLTRVAVIYEKSLRESMKRFLNFLEPALILIVGLIIGFIVISILVSIFSIIDLPF